MPLAQAIEYIALPATVVDALLRQQGPLAPFLELTLACENEDDAAFAKASDTLNLTSQQINWAHLQALSCAEALTD